MMKAALFVGGWEGHAPADFGDWCRSVLEADGFEVSVYDALSPLAEPERYRRRPRS
jgi:type 1 glutamine amidotransferase